MQLSKNFPLKELIRSQTATRKGIDNFPPDYYLQNLEVLALKLLQPVRDEFGTTNVSSGFRSFDLNVAIGGSQNSQHSKGEAADFECPEYSNYEVAKWIANNLSFDQLILEGFDEENPYDGWIHCSYALCKNDKEILLCKFINGKAHYSNYKF